MSARNDRGGPDERSHPHPPQHPPHRHRHQPRPRLPHPQRPGGRSRRSRTGLIKTGDFLERIGGGDLKDGVKSWFGRHVAKAYRAAHGGDPIQMWAQHRTTGKWIRVFVYGPIDEALYEGLFNYRGTQHLLAADFAEAA